MRPTAYLLIHHPIKRYQLFRHGLEAAGYRVESQYDQQTINEDDIVLMWNRKPKDEHIAAAFEMSDARVIVCENGYITPDSAGRRYYAIAIGGHNGSGEPLAMGGPERWKLLEQKVQPYSSGPKILVCGQRGIGAPGMAMPRGWLTSVREEIEAITDRAVEIRKPPSRYAGQPPLEEQLKEAWVVVVWTSNVATAALLRGVTTYVMGPHHVMADACHDDLSNLDFPPPPFAREPVFERMAWHQWSEEEIYNGTPFEYLHVHATAGGSLPTH